MGRFSIVAATIVVLALPSCTIFQRELVEERVTLTPAFTGVHHTHEYYNTGSCDPFTLDRRGLGSPELAQWIGLGGADAVGLLTGYSNDFDRGADPFPCNLWNFHLFQAKLVFDLSTLPAGALVTDARLRSTLTSRTTTARGFLNEGADCHFELGAADSATLGAYTRVSGRENAVAYRRTRPDAPRPFRDDMDVTQTVFDWVTGRRENFGFVVSPERERAFREQENQQTTVYCAAYLTDVSLELTLQVPAPES